MRKTYQVTISGVQLTTALLPVIDCVLSVFYQGYVLFGTLLLHVQHAYIVWFGRSAPWLDAPKRRGLPEARSIHPRGEQGSLKMSATEKHTDLTTEHARYTDARLVRGPEPLDIDIYVKIAGVRIAASGVAGLAIAATVPAALVLLTARSFGVNKYFTLTLAVGVFLATMWFLTYGVVPRLHPRHRRATRGRPRRPAPAQQTEGGGSADTRPAAAPGRPAHEDQGR